MPDEKTEQGGEAEGRFSVPFSGAFSPDQLGKPLEIGIEIVRIKDKKKVYAYNNAGLATSYPAIDTLELFVGVDEKAPERRPDGGH